ncbi:ATP-binding cassette domain-containing protein, partial [Methanosarcina sp. UBA411]|uniref:ATP-binding cassette domain-containing protein n=1 Tax=Methanosarcina sp. UBA411 TaxID=1915589 RepID=UPI003742C53F
MYSLEKEAIFYNESENSTEENSSGENLKSNPYFNSGDNSVNNSNAVRISKNKKEPLLKLTNVWKLYQMGEVEFAALKGINLEIYEGEFLVILGPSGSGKSTLMNLLGCLDIPSKGTVFLNSKDISKLDES